MMRELRKNGRLNYFWLVIFVFQAIDYLNGSGNKCGIYSIHLKVDGELVYNHDLEKVGFHETRYINSHVDFHQAKKHSRKIQKCFKDPNNILGIYGKIQEYSFQFTDDTTHLIEFSIKDAYQNESTLSFLVKSENKPFTTREDTSGQFMKYNKPNTFRNEEITVKLPTKVLYKDLYFKYQQLPKLKRAISNTHGLQDVYTPLQSHISLAIKVDSIPEKYQKKALVVAIDNNNKLIGAEGGSYQNGYLKVKTRSFGAYAVMIDTIKPTIRGYNIFDGKNMKNNTNLRIKISDNLSGIGSYKGYIDDQWVLMEYEYKRAMLTHTFDSARIKSGPHTFKLILKDKRGNEAIYTAKFTK